MKGKAYLDEFKDQVLKEVEETGKAILVEGTIVSPL